MTARYTEAAPVIFLVGSTYNSETIGWTAMTVPGFARVTNYLVYRGNGTNPTAFALMGSSTTTSFVDNTVSTGNYYTYYVIGVYDYGMPTLQSNKLTVLTPSGIQYLYAYKGGGLTVFDALNPYAPFVAAEVSLAIGSEASDNMFQDEQYIYLLTGSQGVSNIIRIIDWATDPLNPTLVASLTNKSGTFSGSIVVRRGVATRNNLLFTLNNNNQIESWGISNPASPSLIATVAAPTARPSMLAYDSSDNKLYMWLDEPGFFTGYGWVAVNNDGTFGVSGFATIHPSAGFLTTGLGASRGRLWVQPSPYDGGYFGYPPPATVKDSGFNDGTDYSTCRPVRFKNSNVAFMPRGIAHAERGAVTILNLPAGSAGNNIVEVGSLNRACSGMASFGGVLIYVDGTNLYVYNVETPASPFLMGSITGLSSTKTNMSGFPDDSWYGNNGLCAT